MIGLYPLPDLKPVIAAKATFIEEAVGKRFVFRYGDYWHRLPEFQTRKSAIAALAHVVEGALRVFEFLEAADPLYVAMPEFGSPWVEWLLPLWSVNVDESGHFWTWTPDRPVHPDWPDGVKQFAAWFRDDKVPSDYAGVCGTRDRVEAVRLCAEMVFWNYAAHSWLFSDPASGISLYFHNTFSFGILAPPEYELEWGRIAQVLKPLPLQYRPDPTARD